MVLNELGSRISSALQALSKQMVIDEAVLDACLKEICSALLQADVNVKLVAGLRSNIKKRVNLEELAAGLNKRKIIDKAVFDELCSILDSGHEAAKDIKPSKGSTSDRRQQPARFGELDKGKPQVVMFVGLQGSGKTTTCTKYAYHYKKKGWRPALVCADTFRAGAFDQLKQNATKASIPFYGSYTETDPALIAAAGVELFKKDGRDLIIVDTSGRHKQEAALFEEMRQVAEAVSPDLVIFVMDGSIGQAAFDQAQAFKESIEVGAVIVTKLDGHAKGGGALSAVSATKSPVIFIGTGEHMDQFESFETKRFVSRLLGKGDLGTLIDRIQDAVPEDKQPELLGSIQSGNMTMRVMKDMYDSLLNMGSMSSLLSMMPGPGANMPQLSDRQSREMYEKSLTIMQSMSQKELDSTNPKIFNDPSRIARIARGSGHTPAGVMTLIETYKQMSKMSTQAMKAAGMPKMGKGGIMRDMPMNQRHMQQMVQRMSGALPPHMMKHLGGAAGLQHFMKAAGEMK